jgi:hypothetical protein
MEVFNINNNIIKTGDNKLLITKNYHYVTPMFYLDINNKKIQINDNKKINDNVFEINFTLTNKAKTKLLVKDGITEEYIPLYFIQEQNYDSNLNLDDLKFNTSYVKDKIFFNIKKSLPLKKDTSLKFEGDINKTIFWRQNTKEIDINFPYQVKGYTTLTFKINGVLKRIKVFNVDDFPRNLIKVKGGLKLNKSCEWDLRVVTDTKEWVIKKGEIFLYLDINENETFKIYIEDYLLFEQKILSSTYLPKLTIVDEPLRIKLSQAFYEDVSVKFKNKNDRWVIPQGQTEINLNYDKGIRLLEIEEIHNAVCDNLTWIYYIK